MKTSDFNYDLPEDLIAKYPPNDRTDSRLLVFSDKETKHEKFSNLLDYLQPNYLLVLNECAVIPARLIGEKETGGKVEVMLERFLSSSQTLVQIKSSRSPKENSIINFALAKNKISANCLSLFDPFSKNKIWMDIFTLFGSFCNFLTQKYNFDKFFVTFRPVLQN